MTSPTSTEVDLPDYVPSRRRHSAQSSTTGATSAGVSRETSFGSLTAPISRRFWPRSRGSSSSTLPRRSATTCKRAIDEVAESEGVSNKVTHIVYSHHHADHAGAADLFGNDLTGLDTSRHDACFCGTTTRPARRLR